MTVLSEDEVRTLVVDLIRAVTRQDLVATALEGVRRLAAADAALWVRVDHGGRRVLASSGLARPDDHLDVVLDGGRGLTGDALRTGRPVVAAAEDVVPLVRPPDGGTSRRWRTVLSLPSGTPGDGVVLTVLYLAPTSPDRTKLEALHHVTRVAAGLATGLEHRELLERETALHRRAADLRSQDDAELRRLAADILQGRSLEDALDALSGRLGSVVYVQRSPTLASGPAERPGRYGDPPAAGPDDRLVKVPGSDLALVGAADPVVPTTELLDRIAVVVGLDLARQRAEIETEIRLAEEVVERMVEGDREGLQRMWYRASLVGVDLASPRILVWLGQGEPMDRRLRDRVRAEVRLRSPRSQIFTYRGDVLVLWAAVGPGLPDPLVDGGAAVRRQVEELIQACRPAPLTGGVSDVCTGSGQHIVATREARLAHQLVADRPGASTMAAAELGMYRLLAQVATPDAMRDSADAQLAPVLALPDRDRDDLLLTLRAFLEHDRRLAETARALHVHVNTLRYRIDRLTRVLGADLEDPDVRLTLLLALRVRGTAPGTAGSLHG